LIYQLSSHDDKNEIYFDSNFECPFCFFLSNCKQTKDDDTLVVQNKVSVSSQVFGSDPSVKPSGLLIIKELDITIKKFGQNSLPQYTPVILAYRIWRC